jgi:hypothetical protein
MIERTHKERGRFALGCLLAHKWGEWSRTILRHYPAPSLDDYWWRQRTCTRCGAKQGEETRNTI